MFCFPERTGGQPILRHAPGKLNPNLHESVTTKTCSFEQCAGSGSVTPNSPAARSWQTRMDPGLDDAAYRSRTALAVIPTDLGRQADGRKISAFAEGEHGQIQCILIGALRSVDLIRGGSADGGEPHPLHGFRQFIQFILRETDATLRDVKCRHWGCHDAPVSAQPGSNLRANAIGHGRANYPTADRAPCVRKTAPKTRSRSSILMGLAT